MMASGMKIDSIQREIDRCDRETKKLFTLLEVRGKEYRYWYNNCPYFPETIGLKAELGRLWDLVDAWRIREFDLREELEMEKQLQADLLAEQQAKWLEILALGEKFLAENQQRRLEAAIQDQERQKLVAERKNQEEKLKAEKRGQEELQFMENILWSVRELFAARPYNNGYEQFLEGLNNFLEEEGTGQLVPVEAVVESVNSKLVYPEPFLDLLIINRGLDIKVAGKVFVEMPRLTSIGKTQVIPSSSKLYSHQLVKRVNEIVEWPTGIGNMLSFPALNWCCESDGLKFNLSSIIGNLQWPIGWDVNSLKNGVMLLFENKSMIGLQLNCETLSQFEIWSFRVPPDKLRFRCLIDFYGEAPSIMLELQSDELVKMKLGEVVVVILVDCAYGVEESCSKWIQYLTINSEVVILLLENGVEGRNLSCCYVLDIWLGLESMAYVKKSSVCSLVEWKLSSAHVEVEGVVYGIWETCKQPHKKAMLYLMPWQCIKLLPKSDSLCDNKGQNGNEEGELMKMYYYSGFCKTSSTEQGLSPRFMMFKSISETRLYSNLSYLVQVNGRSMNTGVVSGKRKEGIGVTVMEFKLLKKSLVLEKIEKHHVTGVSGVDTLGSNDAGVSALYLLDLLVTKETRDIWPEVAGACIAGLRPILRAQQTREYMYGSNKANAYMIPAENKCEVVMTQESIFVCSRYEKLMPISSNYLVYVSLANYLVLYESYGDLRWEIVESALLEHLLKSFIHLKRELWHQLVLVMKSWDGDVAWQGDQSLQSSILNWTQWQDFEAKNHWHVEKVLMFQQKGEQMGCWETLKFKSELSFLSDILLNGVQPGNMLSAEVEILSTFPIYYLVKSWPNYPWSQGMVRIAKVVSKEGGWISILASYKIMGGVVTIFCELMLSNGLVSMDSGWSFLSQIISFSYKLEDKLFQWGMICHDIENLFREEVKYDTVLEDEKGVKTLQFSLSGSATCQLLIIPVVAYVSIVDWLVLQLLRELGERVIFFVVILVVPGSVRIWREAVEREQMKGCDELRDGIKE